MIVLFRQAPSLSKEYIQCSEAVDIYSFIFSWTRSPRILRNVFICRPYYPFANTRRRKDKNRYQFYPSHQFQLQLKRFIARQATKKLFFSLNFEENHSSIICILNENLQLKHKFFSCKTRSSSIFAVVRSSKNECSALMHTPFHDEYSGSCCREKI